MTAHIMTDGAGGGGNLPAPANPGELFVSDSFSEPSLLSRPLSSGLILMSDIGESQRMKWVANYLARQAATIYEVDYAALPNDPAIITGSLIGGVVVSITNQANADYIKIANGTGLMIKPNANINNWGPGNFTAPALNYDLYINTPNSLRAVAPLADINNPIIDEHWIWFRYRQDIIPVTGNRYAYVGVIDNDVLLGPLVGSYRYYSGRLGASSSVGQVTQSYSIMSDLGSGNAIQYQAYTPADQITAIKISKGFVELYGCTALTADWPSLAELKLYSRAPRTVQSQNSLLKTLINYAVTAAGSTADINLIIEKMRIQIR